MVMPLCGTFHYAGVVPDTRAARESGQWQLQDESGAEVRYRPWWKVWKRDPTGDADLDALRYNRLIGLRPTLRISGGHLVLQAPGRPWAQIRSASLELAPSFIESSRGGDILTLVRTGTADVGVSVVRRGRLMVAAGALTAIPLGDDVVVRDGPTVDLSADGPERWPRLDTWIDISVSGEARRLRGGEGTTISDYMFSVVRCFQDGEPGMYACLAITLRGACPHEAALHSAELLARPNAGLTMSEWP